MCLDRLENFKVKLNEDGIGTGYKVFRMDGKLYGEFARRTKERRVGVWLKERNFRLLRTSSLQRIKGRYKQGWHIFLSRQSCHEWGVHDNLVITKIKFRNIVATGRNVDNNRVVVAKEIFIPKEV